jgi:hypothetical protein
MTLQEWFNTPCKEEEIAYLDAEKTIAYIPIGIVETILDEVGTVVPDAYWDTVNFKFSAFKSVNTTFASGSLELRIYFIDKIDKDGYKSISREYISRVGAATVPIYSQDEIKDYEGVVLSMALSNAAKKLGKRFGRHLNGRMEIGETAVKIKTPPEDAVVVGDVTEERLIALIKTSTSIEDLASFKKYVTPNTQGAYMQKMREFAK